MTDIDKVLDNQSQSNYSFLMDKEEEKHIEIDYDSLVYLEKKDFSAVIEDEEKDDVVFFCKSCKAITDVERIPSLSKKKKKVQFSCITCKKKNVFYGTRRGVMGYFHLNG